MIRGNFLGTEVNGTKFSRFRPELAWRMDGKSRDKREGISLVVPGQDFDACFRRFWSKF